MDDLNKALTDIELGLIQKTGVLAAARLKVAKLVVTDGGFASAAIAPILVAAPTSNCHQPEWTPPLMPSPSLVYW
jgi:hypothetical protein